MTFRHWTFVCIADGTKVKKLQWDYELAPACPACQQVMRRDVAQSSKGPAIHGDECDVTVEHGLCNADGTPRRYRSRSELRDAARAQGLVHASEFGEYGSKWNPKRER